MPESQTDDFRTDAAAPAWHALPADEVLRRLAAQPDAGLGSAEALRRRTEHGANALPERPAQAPWRTFGRQLASPLVTLLFVAATLALALGELRDAGVILAVVLINALIGSVQEGRAERSMAALRRLAALHVRALRDGREQDLEAGELVPGDILLLAAGDAVSADARLLEAVRLQAAEAALTGESLPVAKTPAALPEATGLADRHCMVYAGSHVTAGRARAVVVAIGEHTEVGRIARLTARAEQPTTPLEQRIRQFGRWLVGAALGLFMLVVLLGLWRRLPLAEVLMVAISQMVSMVPEGLPVAMTIALAVGMQRMAARGAIIRRLSAVETLGSTTVICSDKTGTLTRNEMTVTALWLPRQAELAAREFAVSGSGYAPAGAISAGGQRTDTGAISAGGQRTDTGAISAGAVDAVTRDSALAALLQAGALCNDAELLAPVGERGAWTVLGDPTEGALLVLAVKAGIDPAALRSAAPREAELPFDSDLKLMATRHRLPDAPRRVFVKGAPEAVLRLCAADAPATLQAARGAADALAARALRVLAFARVDDDVLDPGAGFDALAGRARLLGLVGQIDPPREEAKAAVDECRAAGIRVVVLTGDHKLTGLAIARELGLARADDRAVDGTELERMGQADLRDALARIAVFARVQPAQKLRIVEALQAHGEVVAMTGDGVNDAPALARADVGVAMGRSGTEVAKSAARVVITDDNFATIVGAVEQGRVVHDNLKKVILYLFATSIDEVVVLMAALFAGYPLPLAAVQILWINIVTEGTLTVNLVLDPPDPDTMRRPPVPRDEPLVDRAMLVRGALMASASVLVTFGWFAWRMSEGADIGAARTETFTLLAMCQWFNVLNCQSATRSTLRLGVLRNPWLLTGLALSVLLQAAVLLAPPLNAMFHTLALSWPTLAALLGLASVVLWTEELRKVLVRRRRSAAAAR